VGWFESYASRFYGLIPGFTSSLVLNDNIRRLHWHYYKVEGVLKLFDLLK
jgi:hypothetical protein